MATKPKEDTIEIQGITTSTIDFCVLGTSPIILNSMSAKVRQELLAPRGRKTAADKASTMKHDPRAEFLASMTMHSDDEGLAPTRLKLLSTAFKGALRSVALDLPGAAKAQIGRLTFVRGSHVDLYGTPRMLMSVTRSADAARTPDIRTRAIVPEWAARVSITFVTPLLRDKSIANLLAAAGVMRGVGDWRPEKGSGSYGQFTLVPEDDADFQRVLATGARAAQDDAIALMEPFDAETQELWSWFTVETARRGFKAA